MMVLQKPFQSLRAALDSVAAAMSVPVEGVDDCGVW